MSTLNRKHPVAIAVSMALLAAMGSIWITISAALFEIVIGAMRATQLGYR